MKKLFLSLVISLAILPAFSQSRGALVMKDTSASKNKPTGRYEMRLDSAGNIQFWNKVVDKQVHFSGYAAVTQLTSATTTVVSNYARGVITTVALTTAADASFEFTFTNSTIKTGSVILLTGLTAGTGVVHPALVSVGNGTCVIRVTNVGTAAFNALAKIHYVVL